MKIANKIVYTGSRLILNDTVKAPNLFTISMVTKKAKEVQRIPKKSNHPKSDNVISKACEFNLPVKRRKTEMPIKPVDNS
jgi:hypothetical protein